MTYHSECAPSESTTATTAGLSSPHWPLPKKTCSGCRSLLPEPHLTCPDNQARLKIHCMITRCGLFLLPRLASMTRVTCANQRLGVMMCVSNVVAGYLPNRAWIVQLVSLWSRVTCFVQTRLGDACGECFSFFFGQLDCVGPHGPWKCPRGYIPSPTTKGRVGYPPTLLLLYIQGGLGCWWYPHSQLTIPELVYPDRP